MYCVGIRKSSRIKSRGCWDLTQLWLQRDGYVRKLTWKSTREHLQVKNSEDQTQGTVSRNRKAGEDSDILTGELARIGDEYPEAKGKEGAREASKGLARDARAESDRLHKTENGEKAAG